MAISSHVKRIGRGRAEKQSAILEAAVEEFARFGFKGASIANIAKRAGMPRPNLHYYYSSKLRLYQQILMNILELWNSTFDGISAGDDPATVISEYIHAKVMYSKTNPLASKIFAMEIIHGGVNLGEFLKNDYKQWLKEKTSIIEQWARAGKMDPIDPHHLMFMIWGSTQFYADFSVQVESGLNMKSLDDLQFENIAKTITQVVLKGCGIK